MQRHSARFHVDAPRSTVWKNLHPPAPPGAEHPRVIEYEAGRIEILFEGDDAGQGLVRICTYNVPKLIGGRARSWECVVESRTDEYSRYIAVTKPIWAHAEGWQELADAPDGGTLVTFTETYEIYNRVFRPLERYIHGFISRDNDKFFALFLGRSGTVRKVG